MKALLDNFAAVLGGATVSLLLLSVVHEYAYFFVVGQHFQTILSTTDYFSNAVLWLPFLLAMAYAVLDWQMLLGKRTTFKIDFSAWGIFNALLIFGIPIGFLFLPFAGYSPFIWSGCLLWMLYGGQFLPLTNLDKEYAPIIRRMMIVVPVVAAWVFIQGYRLGKDDLSSFENPYDVELKNGTILHRVMLRTFDKGILVRDANAKRLEFIRWDDMAKLSRYASFSTTPLSCRWFGVNCPSVEP